MKPWHRASRDAVEEVDFDFLIDELLPVPAPTIAMMQADCCCARAVYRVLLPASPGREHRAELLFCAHHFRASRAGLQRANATAFDANNKTCLVST